MASQTSMPRSRANMASSLTSAMLTWRKVFSSSLVSSASRVPDDRHRRVDDVVEEPLHRRQRGVVDARDDLRGVLEAPGGVAGVDALGAVAEVEVRAGPQARALLEDRRDQLLGGARVGGRLQDDRGPAPEVRGHGGRGGLDVGQVGHALAHRGGHRDDRHVEAGQVGGVRSWPGSGRWRATSAELVVGDVLDVGRARRSGRRPCGRRPRSRPRRSPRAPPGPRPAVRRSPGRRRRRVSVDLCHVCPLDD